MVGKPNCLAQMVEAYEKVGGNIVAALEVPDSETHKYGVIDPGATDGRLTEIRGMVEKPAPGTAPSNLMLPGRYILQPEVMRALDAQEKGAGGEIQLTDAMAKLIGTAAVPRLPLRGRALRLRQRGGLRDREYGDGAGARGCGAGGARVPVRRHRTRSGSSCSLTRRSDVGSAGMMPGAKAPLSLAIRRRLQFLAQLADLDRALDDPGVERRIVVAQPLANRACSAIRRSIRATSTSKWKGLRITSSAPAS